VGFKGELKNMREKTGKRQRAKIKIPGTFGLKAKRKKETNGTTGAGGGQNESRCGLNKLREHYGNVGNT